MTKLPRIMLIQCEPDTTREIRGVLNSFSGAVVTPLELSGTDEVPALIQQTTTCMAFLEIGSIEQGVLDTSQLSARFPYLAIVVIAPGQKTDWILPLIRAGATEYLTKPVNPEEVAAVIEKISRKFSHYTDPGTGKGAAVSVYNPSGGMGTTTIAVNLAASLITPRNNVVLVDMNFACGDMTTFLDLTPRYTLASTTDKLGKLDSSFLRSVIVKHSSGLDILCAPTDLADAGRIQPDHIREIIAVLRSMYAYTVIDTGGQLYGCNLSAFTCSDLVLFVTILNLTSLKNAKKYLAAMKYEGLGSDKVKLIVNRANHKDDIRTADAERILATRPYLSIPNSYQDIATSITKGVPTVFCHPRSAVTKAVQELSEKISCDVSPKEP